MPAYAKPELRTDRLVVRLAILEDVPEIVDYYLRNKEHMRPWSPQWPNQFHTESYWRQQVHSAAFEFTEGRSCRCFLFLPKSNRVIGVANLSNIVRGVFQACHLGYSLDERHVGHGYMTEGLEALIAYAFADLRLRRIMANYIPWNRRSHRVLERLGFVIEGYAKGYLRIDGQWQDHVLTSLTNPDWQDD